MLPNKGLFTDTQSQNQPDGTYSFALNALHDATDGGIGTLIQEHGNQLLTQLPGAIAGYIPLYDNGGVLFVEPGYIYLLENKTLSLLHQDPLFGFSRKYPITGRSTVINGCERIVYWCNGKDPDYFYNLDKPDRYVTINDFRLNPLVNHVQVLPTVVDGGGYLKYGSYQFVVEILDETSNLVLRSFPSPVTYIGTALNIDVNTEEVGGQPPSSQAIELTINNLNEEFPFIRIGVIAYNTGNGITPISHYVADLIPITDTTVSYTYTGINTDAGDTLTDFRELLTNSPVYETSAAMVDVQGSLLRMAVTEQVDDFAKYQRAASKIEVHYVTELVPKDELLDVKSEQGDEIRALGIVFIKRNGQHLAPFHIPGRPRLESDMEMVNDPIAGNVRQWEAVNTAYRTNTTDTGSEGKCGYYETTFVYRPPTNFCGDDYWGSDYAENNLLLQPVRHHRLPCRTLEPLINGDDGNTVRKIGFKFSNVEYPSDDIVSHYFVSNTLSRATSTVAAAGYMLPYNTESDVSGDKREGRYVHYLPNPNDNEQFTNALRQNFISLEYLTSGRPPAGQYVKINGFARSLHEQNRPEFTRFFDNGDDLFLYGKHHTITTYTTVNERIRIMVSRSYVRASTTLNIPNRSLSSDFNIVSLASLPETFALNRANFNYTYIKKDIKPFNNLYGIKYRLLGNIEIGVADSYTVYDGDMFLNKLDMTNISDLNGSTTLHNIFSRDRNYVEYELLRGLIIESPINFNRRHAGSEPCNNYYTEDQPIDLIIANKIARRVDDGNTRAWVLRAAPCKEWYGYNNDYGITSPRLFVPLTQLFDFCSNCLNDYPNRIIYSKTASAEQTEDAWRIYAALDYVDIPAHRGRIIAADLYQNDLLIRCESGVFILRPNTQTIELSGTTAYLGTGKFLAIPAVELDSSANGYGGQQSRLGSCVTPQGIVWVDQHTGKVFLFNGKLDEISRTGMYNYFAQTLKPNTLNHFLGVIVSYDPRFERILIHYNEFKNGELNGFYRYIDDVMVPYTDNQLENNSFTISFSVKHQAWLSWHSYQPAFMFYAGNTLFSSIALDVNNSDKGLYSHDLYSKFCTFYNQAFPYIVEVTEKNQSTSQLSSVEFYTQCQEFDSTTETWKTIRSQTYDGLIAYTNLQSSGRLDLKLTNDPYRQAQWLNTEKVVIEADQNYRIGGIRDLSTTEPVISKSWTLRSPSYTNGQGYIDHVPVNINPNIPQYQQTYIRDKFVKIRLFFTDTSKRLITFITTSRNFPTLR